VFLAGTPEEVDAQSEALGGTVVAGHRWPEPMPHPVVVALRVPSGETAAAVARLPSSVPRQAGHGVGQVLAGWPGDALDDLAALRRWAELRGGSLVVVRGSEEVRRTVDPWGTPPRSTALQRRVKAAFDPLGTCNPGILPGGI
jgi:FAD/FMN-containing dehydrogenase